jgi:Tfp pilus assembly major pilin PilA
MNNHKQDFIVTILIILITILAISAGLYLYQTNNHSVKAPINIQTTNATQTNNTSNSKIYSNSQYGFQFSYPSTVSTNDGTLSVNVVSQPLTQDMVTSGINTFIRTPESDNITTISVDGITSYRHNFTTAVGYEWTIIQIPLDANHYIEIGYTFGTTPRIV